MEAPIFATPPSWLPTAPPLLLAGLMVLLLMGLATPPNVDDSTKRRGDDEALFRAVAERVSLGEPYYPAMADELVARGYPTGSVANWRTPLYLEVVAHAPLAMRGLLLLVSLLVIAGTALALRSVSIVALIAGLTLQSGAVIALWFGQLQVKAEPLTGGLIALSVLVSLRGWRATSVLLGTAAMFVRELAVPYMGVRLGWALWTRDWRDAICWLFGIAAYGVFLLWHIGQVHQAMPAHPTWHTMSWIQFGGLRFVLATLRTNDWLHLLPWWMAPVALVAALLGAWKAPPVVRLSVLGYLGAFAMVGQPFNWYWGWVPGMLFPLLWGQITSSQTVRATSKIVRI
jgi:hypothetical protein